MLAINLIREQDGRTKVGGIHHDPFHLEYGIGTTEEEIEAAGYILVESLPEPDNNGKLSTMYYDEATKQFSFEYTDVEPTEDEKRDIIVGKLVMENASNKETIETLEQLVGELVAEIATIKGGV